VTDSSNRRKWEERVAAVATSAWLASIALWVGGSLFFSGIVLPILFLGMPPAEAGNVAALLFPAYFQFGMGTGVVALAAAFLLARRGGRRWRAATVLLALMLLAQGWVTFVVHPPMQGIRGDEAHAARFQELHQRSVRLNAVVLLGGVLLLGAGGALLRPRDDRA
jgi:hypothetical protein